MDGSLKKYCEIYGHGDHIVGTRVEFIDDGYAERFGRTGTIYKHEYDGYDHFYGFRSDETGEEKYGFFAYRFDIIDNMPEIPDVDADALVCML